MTKACRLPLPGCPPGRQPRGSPVCQLLSLPYFLLPPLAAIGGRYNLWNMGSQAKQLGGGRNPLVFQFGRLEGS